jgi:hypothetical protein
VAALVPRTDTLQISRYALPALSCTESLLLAGRREIAHLEAGVVIGLRITRDGWAQARQDFADDPAVLRDPSRRDWIELHLKHDSGLHRLVPLLAIAAAASA